MSGADARKAPAASRLPEKVRRFISSSFILCKIGTAQGHSCPRLRFKGDERTPVAEEGGRYCFFTVAAAAGTCFRICSKYCSTKGCNATGISCAADLRSALSVLDTALHILGPKCLARRLHFDRGFAADVGGTLAENLADLAHGSELLGLLNTLIAILAADTAAGLFAGLVGVAFAGAFALLILRLLGFVARLAVLRIALLLLAALLAILGGLLLLAAVLLPLALLLLALVGPSLLLAALVALLRLNLRKQVLYGVLHFAQEAGVFAGIAVLLAARLCLILLAAIALLWAVGWVGAGVGFLLGLCVALPSSPPFLSPFSACLESSPLGLPSFLSAC